MALGGFAHALPTGHGHRVVVQNFVSDVDPSGNALAHRQHAAVKVSAVANVGKHVGVVAERLLAHPGHALTTHLGKACGAAVHPKRHEVTTNAGHGARAFGHAGAGVVWATRAKPGLAIGLDLQHLHGPLFGVKQRHMRLNVGTGICVHTQAQQTLGDGARDHRRRQVGMGTQQGVGAGVVLRPLAAVGVARLLTELAHHAGALAIGPVVQALFDLVFDHLALFFDHQNLLQAARKLAGAVRLQWPHHPHLVHANAQAVAGSFVQPQIEQGLARVVIGLAAGHQAEAVVGALDGVVVEPVGADISQSGIPLVGEQALLLSQGVIGPADVHATCGHVKSGHHDVDPLRVDDGRGAGLDHLLDGFHARPHAGKAAQRQGVHTHVQNVLHRRREKHRHATGLEDVVALVRSGAAFGHVVVTGHRHHPAPRGGAGHGGVFEHVRAAVHPGAFAIPNAKHAVKAAAGRGRKAQLLGAPQSGGGQLLVDTGLEHDVLGLQVGLGLPQSLVVATQRGTPVAADEASGVFALQGIALALQHGQLDQGLHAAHEGAALVEGVFVVQGHCFQRLADVFGQRGVHGLSPGTGLADSVGAGRGFVSAATRPTGAGFV